jgi:hypothetical protein
MFREDSIYRCELSYLCTMNSTKKLTDFRKLHPFIDLCQPGKYVTPTHQAKLMLTKIG